MSIRHAYTLKHTGECVYSHTRRYIEAICIKVINNRCIDLLARCRPVLGVSQRGFIKYEFKVDLDDRNGKMNKKLLVN